VILWEATRFFQQLPLLAVDMVVVMKELELTVVLVVVVLVGSESLTPLRQQVWELQTKVLSAAQGKIRLVVVEEVQRQLVVIQLTEAMEAMAAMEFHLQ
jgi:hypothetical protein